MELIILIIVTPILLDFIIFYYKYNNSGYKDVNHSHLLKVRYDKGLYGEFLTFYRIEKKIPDAKILTNVYIPKESSGTTEIDLLMIHHTGIYCFESKNYGGWIYGNGRHKYWTQTFKNGEKNKFYNPIFQNSGHINHLAKYLDMQKENFYSIIVFSQRCTLKKISNIGDEVIVKRRPKVTKALEQLISKNSKKFTHDLVDQIYSTLKEHTNVSKEIMQQHIQNIKK